MKKIYVAITTLFAICLFTACSPDQHSAQKYEQESPITAELSTPSQLGKGTVTATLTQNNEPVAKPDYVHFEIWKQDGSLNYSMEEAQETKEGVFTLQKEFPSEGLYFVKVHASSNDSIIMPTKQFIIGTLSESDKAFLASQISKEKPHSMGHH